MIYLATKTLAAIEAAIARDQGSEFRRHLQEVLPQMNDAYRQGKEDFRSHMGASGIGKDCGRAIWYGFRWHTAANFEGRLLRLFNRGHLEEARFIACLLTIGCKIYQQDANGKQFAISASHGHYGGSGDGVAVGIPDLPKPTDPALCEFKTHNAKSFAKLEDLGVRGAKLEHYIQMQQYMRKMQLAYGLYLAVNKDTDQLYGEIILLDTELADRFLQRADKIVWMKQPPKRIRESPGARDCKYCDHKPVCHLRAQPAVNCRSCLYSYPAENKQWGCTLHNIGLTKEMQLQACASWSPIKENQNASETA